MVKNAKIESLKCDIFGDFQTLWVSKSYLSIIPKLTKKLGAPPLASFRLSSGQFYNCNFKLVDTLWKGGWLECLKDFFSFKLSIRSFEGLWIALSLSFI